MFARFRPSRESIVNSRLLRWLGPRLQDAHLWHVNRRAVARGMAAGTFFGLMIPAAQIPAAVIAALLIRGNLWAAALATLISNPLTYAPLYYAAYRLGDWLLGRAPTNAPPPEQVEATITAMSSFAQAWQWISGVGQPLLLGMAIMAVSGAAVAYFGTLLVWRIHTAIRLRRRRHADTRASLGRS